MGPMSKYIYKKKRYWDLMAKRGLNKLSIVRGSDDQINRRSRRIIYIHKNPSMKVWPMVGRGAIMFSALSSGSEIRRI